MDTKLFLSACAAALIAAGNTMRDYAVDIAEDAPAPKSKAKPKAAADEDEPAPKPKAKPKAAEPDDDALDYETDVRPAVVSLSKDHGRDAALEVLEKFTNPATDEPCTKGQEVAPEDYPALLKAIKKARAKLDAEAD